MYTFIAAMRITLTLALFLLITLLLTLRSLSTFRSSPSCTIRADVDGYARVDTHTHASLILQHSRHIFSLLPSPFSSLSFLLSVLLMLKFGIRYTSPYLYTDITSKYTHSDGTTHARYNTTHSVRRPSDE